MARQRATTAPTLALSPAPAPGPAVGIEDDAPALSPEQAQERQELLERLAAQRWNVSHVAKALGVSRNTLYRRMHKLRIPVTQSV
jgi:transcriptional regulator of acetoin/glycerol metabolism